MKKFLLLAALAAITAIPAVAQSKEELFSKIVKLSQDKKPEKKAEAYKLSKDYLAKFGKDTDANTKKIVEFVEKYRVNEFNVALDQSRYEDAFELGKDLLEINPDDSYVTMSLAYAGYEALTKKKDSGFADAAIGYAKKTIELFAAGKLPKSFVPFKDQQDATAIMYYAMASLQQEFYPFDAVTNFYNSFKYESAVKTEPYPYYVIAKYYDDKMVETVQDLQTNHANKPASDPKVVAINKRLDDLMDRAVDAYARAVKHSKADSPNISGWTARLTDIYKFRKGSDTGVKQFMDGILGTPMPEPKSFD